MYILIYIIIYTYTLIKADIYKTIKCKKKFILYGSRI